MRDIFPEYFTPTSEEFDELWNAAFVSFDANVLLHILRFKQDSAEEIIKVLENIGDRAWITNQAAKEFLSRRHNVFLELANPYNELSKKLSELMDAFQQRVEEVAKRHRDHPSLDFEKIKADSRKGFRKLQHKLEKSQSRHPTDSHADELVERVASMFTGKVGPAPTTAERQAVEKEGKDRYAKNVPPGFMDQGKDDGGFGDLFVWKQLIDKSRTEKKPVIFVTDDTKEDWWQRVNGRTIGPRPELRNEFVRETGQQFYMYSLSNYLSHTKMRGVDVSASAIREAQNQYKRDRRLHIKVNDVDLDKYREFLLGKMNAEEARVPANLDRLATEQKVSEVVRRWRRHQELLHPNKINKAHETLGRLLMEVGNSNPNEQVDDIESIDIDDTDSDKQR
jgi:hypothetical protein